jgi:predicted PurR-regulated permease PerM
MRIKNALFLALIISLLDILPLIGVGTVILPWGIFQILFGSVAEGIGLIVLLIVHEVVRQFAEPKIVGKSLGLHPIISLVLLYVGYSLFGFAGLLLTPVVGIVAGLLINKNDASKIG